MRNRNPTILVVEDNLDDQHFIRRGFKKVGVESPVHVVGDGLEAIAYMMGDGKFADRQEYAYPTFIVTDLKMPGADGFEVCLSSKKSGVGRYPDHCTFILIRFGRH